jgi:biotin-(acetyl-CoA carboxylase) ligase
MSNAIRLSCAAVAVLFSIVIYAEQPALTGANVRNVIYTKSQEMQNKYLNILKRHEFADPNEWQETVMRVFNAYGTYKMQQQSPAMVAQMQQAIAQIESNPSLTDQQKQQMLQMMQQSNQSMRAFVDASSADVKAVKPFVAEIDKTFDK